MKKKLKLYERHNIILERLHNGETLSITALANEWDFETKTIQRDFKMLQEGHYGVVRTEDGKRFKLSNESHLSQNALSAVKMLDSLSADIGGAFYAKAQSALHQIQRHIDSPYYMRIDVESVDNKLELIAELETAVTKQKMISFDYRPVGKKEIKHHQDVKPYRIIIFRGFWYLLARSGDLVIKYYLKEIRNLKIQGQSFVQEEKILDRLERAHDIWFQVDTEPFDVTLWLDYWTTIYFQRKPIKDQYLKKNSDGTAELTISVTTQEEVFSILKQWLPQIKVIEPYALQEAFDTMLSSYMKHT